MPLGGGPAARPFACPPEGTPLRFPHRPNPATRRVNVPRRAEPRCASAHAIGAGAIALLTDTGVLAATPLFGELTDEQRKLVAFGARRRELRAGDVLYSAGRPAEGATVVLRGAFDLSNDEGAERRVGAATLLDELALLTRRSHAWTATAATDAVVLPIDRTLFRRLLEEYPDIAAQVRERIAARLGRLADAMEPIAQRMEAAEKLTRRD